MRIIWRVAFVLSGVAMIAGGPQHPSPDLALSFHESTAVMLANPRWVPSHVGLLASYVLLFLALWLWGRQAQPAGATRTWLRFALVAVGFGIVEMVFHTAAVVDLESLRQGGSTPILTTHLVLAALVNPVFGVAVAGIAVRGAIDRQLGSLWVAWMAVAGGLIYGLASAYVVATHDQRVSPLFAIGASLMAFWFLFAGVWRVRASAPGPVQSLGAPA